MGPPARRAQRSVRLVVLDLRELTFMDSSGVHVIVDAGRRVRQMRRRLILVRSCMQVDDVFAVTGASEAIEIGDLDTIGPPSDASHRSRRSGGRHERECDDTTARCGSAKTWRERRLRRRPNLVGPPLGSAP